MLCIAEIASCRTSRPAAVQLRKLVAAGEIPATSVCSAPGTFILFLNLKKKKAPGHTRPGFYHRQVIWEKVQNTSSSSYLREPSPCRSSAST